MSKGLRSVVSAVTRPIESVVEAVGSVAETVVNTATNTIDAVLQDPVKALPIAVAIAAPGVGSAIGTALGATGTTASVLGNAIVGGLGSEVTGGDFVQGAVEGALGAGLGSVIPGTGVSAVDEAILGGTTAALTGGDVARGAVSSALASGLASTATGSPALDFAPDSFPLDVPASTIDGFDYGSIGGSVTPDYSLTPAPAPVEGPFIGQGLEAPPQTGSVFLPDGSVDYGFSVPDTTQGLRTGVAPALPNMGGGQGLVAEVPGGVVTEAGFIPETQPVVIGNPESFINREGGLNESAAAKALQDQLLGSALQGIFQGMLVSNLMQPSSQPSAVPSVSMPNTMPVYDQAYFDAVQQQYNALAPQGLMANVSEPLQQWYAPETSITERLFGG